MEKKHLDKFKKRLEKLRAEIIKIITNQEERPVSRDVVDDFDQATDLIEFEMGSFMSSNFKANLQKVDEALKRINDGTYGTCLNCSKEIALKRLDVLPFATHCIECQKNLENDIN